MKTIQVKMNDSDFQRFNFQDTQNIDFEEFVRKLNSDPEKKIVPKKIKQKATGTLRDVFGLWKNDQKSLVEIRKKQWERKVR